ncbi:hypothetical protein [Methylobrevis pamukkalensis]|uniref:Beta-barrel assembly machine subunit BamF n=1 Tax=Methylobrevis pamukkalensis TaxID=1439726 RepID=A0A1E3H5M6_9HYPH|nr:hypothetical protein [Methylobrevis pamukkalensis]ODN71604.1 hypothetical protein A6302_01025 [Methylobrevis pamukkalensis]
MTRKWLGHFALLVVGSISLGACSSVTTFTDEDDGTESGSGSLGRGLLTSVGAVPERQASINYQPRAPLVVPASTAALPAPEDPDQVAQLADWPVDPDVERQRRFREAARRDAERGDSAVVPASDMVNVTTGREGTFRTQREKKFDKNPATPLTSTELNAGAALYGASAGGGLYDSAGNPVRPRLVAPPTEYLRPSDQYPVAIPEPEDDPKKNGIFGMF